MYYLEKKMTWEAFKLVVTKFWNKRADSYTELVSDPIQLFGVQYITKDTFLGLSSGFLSTELRSSE